MHLAPRAASSPPCTAEAHVRSPDVQCIVHVSLRAPVTLAHQSLPKDKPTRAETLDGLADLLLGCLRVIRRANMPLTLNQLIHSALVETAPTRTTNKEKKCWKQ